MSEIGKIDPVSNQLLPSIVVPEFASIQMSEISQKDEEGRVARGSDICEVVLSFGKDVVRLGFSKQRMLRDLRRTATERGLVDTDVEKVVQNLDFNFYSKQSLSLEEIFDHLIQHKLSDLATSLRKNKSTLLAGLYNDGEKREVFFCAEDILHDLDKKTTKSPFEVRHMAVEQTFAAMWRHEREHILQLCDPAKVRVIEREDKVYATCLKMASLVTGLSLFAAGTDAPAQSLLMGSYLLFLSTSQMFWYKLSLQEKEAMQMEDYTNWVPERSMFDVTFENVKRPY